MCGSVSYTKYTFYFSVGIEDGTEIRRGCMRAGELGAVGGKGLRELLSSGSGTSLNGAGRR